ncbi:hypothetical protein IFM89_032997 [Coptis chinensis]|uniref:Uncharacterized protein n=1 Tax=Coptis chinensis TaxID=261450 RepID=A0A835M5A1_9MAGN|nr:hypothetical protein IFM89_032996 [Coptis chinensis]KAF9616927.1 hypothetical protein IFM89_032997 [Coptis chinensis]
MTSQQQPEGHHHLCANGCGFFGTPSNRNLCSKCYRDVVLNEAREAEAKQVINKSFNNNSVSAVSVSDVVAESVNVEESCNVEVKKNRCFSCNKRVGLTGFKCKCGDCFCTTHRYPESHDCSFDFKASGRDAIAKSNPVIKAEKLVKF